MSRWTDRDGRPADAPPPPATGSWYAEIGDFQGRCYERNAFALGTAQEVPVLVEALGLEPGMLALDVGCGTGRHARALVERGLAVIGIDLSHALLRRAGELLPDRWARADASSLPLPDGAVDAALCLCQGGFSIGRAPDARALAELSRVLRRGGRAGVTAYSRAFAERFLVPGEAIDRERGLVYTPAVVRGPDGRERRFDLWTQCYTPDELREMGATAGLTLEAISIGEPGNFSHTRPSASDPEWLVTYSKP